MSKFLKLFSSMSGMQKLVLEEALSEEEKRFSNSRKPDTDRELADKLAMGITGDEKGKPISAGKLTHEFLQHAKATGQDTADKEASERLATIDSKIDSIQQKLSSDFLSSKDRESLLSQLENAKNDRDAAIAFNKTELEKSEFQAKQAERKLKGKSKEESRVSNRGLSELNPLIVPKKPEGGDISGSRILSFDEMLSVARSKAADSKDFNLFRTTIEQSNKLFSKLFNTVRDGIKKKDKFFADGDIKFIFDSIAPDPQNQLVSGNVESDPDLVKICWLYLADPSVFEAAKNKPAFIEALTKLEGTKKQSITKPIADIASLDDMFYSDSVKNVLSKIKSVENKEPELFSTISSGSKTIIDAPESLYTGFSSTEAENIADTLYYAIINTFGLPDDKVKLLKSKGIKRQAGEGFLTKEATDFVNKELKYFTNKVQGGKALSSKKSRGKGIKEHLNSGMQISKMLSGRKSVGTKTVDQVKQDEIDSLVAAKLNTGVSFKGTIKSPDGRIISVANLIKDKLASSSSVPVVVLKNALRDSFEGILDDTNKELDGVRDRPERVEIYQAVLDKITSDFDEILVAFDYLQQPDIDKLVQVFKSAVEPEREEKSVTVSAESEEGKTLTSFVKDILDSIEYETSTSKASPDVKNKGLESTEVTALESELKSLDDNITKLANNNDEASRADIANLEVERASLLKELEAAKNELQVMGSPSEKVLAGRGSQNYTNMGKVATETDSMRTLSIAKEALREVISNAIETINVDTLYRAVLLVPQSILNYVDIALRESAFNVIDSILDTSAIDEESAKWQQGLRKSLRELSQHMSLPTISDKPEKIKALSILTTPFRADLESASNFAVSSISKLNKRLSARELSQAKKEGKREGRKESAEEKAILTTQSIVPGSSFRGSVEVRENTALMQDLLRNLQNLDFNAKDFYSQVLKTVKDLNLGDLVSKEGTAFSSESDEQLTALMKLIGRFKATLSTELDATDTENSLFLQDLVDKKLISLQKGEGNISRTKTSLDFDTLKAKLKESDDFINLIDVLNQAKDNKTILWPKEIINAPVIGFESGRTLDIKSATLLNILSGLKNFSSIQSFDLSLNKQNKDILSAILDSNTYPKIFTLSPSTALVMKLYFISKLKQLVTNADVIGQFSGDFIGVQLNTDPNDEVGKKAQELLNNRNRNAEASMLAELKKDFDSGGTLDAELSEGLQTLQKIAEDSGGSITTITGNYRLKVVPVGEGDNLEAFVLKQGSDMLLSLTGAMGKSTLTPAFAKMVLLLSPGQEELAAKSLSDCIHIVKTGINFYCGLEAIKTISYHEFYDRATKQLDAAGLDRRISKFESQPEFVAFTEKFTTVKESPEAPENVGPQITTQVSKYSKQGFSNLKNAFLSSFLKDFVWNSITNTAVESGFEKAEIEDSERIASRTQKDAIENNLPVFIKGLFKPDKNVKPEKEASASTTDEEPEETVEDSDKINVSETDNVLKVQLDLSPSAAYKNVTNVTSELSKGYIEGGVSSGRAPGGGGRKFTFASQLGVLLSDYAVSVSQVSNILYSLYSNYPDIVSEVREFSTSISQSSPKLTNAINKIETTPYNEEIQKAAIAQLQSMTAQKPPSYVLLFSNPREAFKDASNAFKDTSHPYHNIFSFADRAATDIIKNKTTMSAILDSINNLLASKSFDTEGAELELPTASEKAIKILNTVEINNILNTFFTKPMTDANIFTLLSNVKNTLGGFPNSEVSVPKETEPPTITAQPEEVKSPIVPESPVTEAVISDEQEPKITGFLKSLLQKATSIVPSITTKNELEPIKHKLQLVINFIQGLIKESGNSVSGNEILNSFTTFSRYLNTFNLREDTRSLTQLAVDKFKLLLEELKPETVEPDTTEAIHAQTVGITAKQSYILGMAKFLSSQGYTKAEEYVGRVKVPGKSLPENISIIPGAIEAAVIVKLFSGNTSPFKGIKKTLTDKLRVGFSVGLGDEDRATIYLPYTDLHGIKLLANHDEAFINSLGYKK